MARREFRGTSAVPVDLTIVSRPSLDVDVVGARNHFFGTRTMDLLAPGGRLTPSAPVANQAPCPVRTATSVLESAQ